MTARLNELLNPERDRVRSTSRSASGISNPLRLGLRPQPRSALACVDLSALAQGNLPPLNTGPVAQVGNLLYRRLAVGRSSPHFQRLRIANPRYSRLPVCATLPLIKVRASVNSSPSRYSPPGKPTNS